MRGFKFLAIVVLLTAVNTLCSGAVTRNNGNNIATVLGPGSMKVHDSQTGKTTILDGSKGKVRREINTSVIEPHGSHVPIRVRRVANTGNTSVIEHLGPKTADNKTHGHTSDLVRHNASGKVRRETNSSITLHHVLLTRGRMRRGAKLLSKDPNTSNGASTTMKPTHSPVNVSSSVAATTPKGFGNMITVPDNCPEGKQFVNGECREIWEPSR